MIKQVAWCRPRATDLRVVQSAHNLVALTNLFAALLGALPNLIGADNSARSLLTGVAARRVGVYVELILIVIAFFPKLIDLIAAISQPILATNVIFVMSLLFVQGMMTVIRDGVDGPKAAVVGISLSISIGFQSQVILPDLLTGTVGTLLGNGITPGALCVILLTLIRVKL